RITRPRARRTSGRRADSAQGHAGTASALPWTGRLGSPGYRGTCRPDLSPAYATSGSTTPADRTRARVVEAGRPPPGRGAHGPRRGGVPRHRVRGPRRPHRRGVVVCRRGAGCVGATRMPIELPTTTSSPVTLPPHVAGEPRAR